MSFRSFEVGPANCGSDHSVDCCTSGLVTGGTFYRSNDKTTALTKVADFRLDNLELTVQRFRKFVAGFPTNLPAQYAGKNPTVGADPGWNANWNASFLPASQKALTDALKSCGAASTWTDTAGANESFPITCLDWFEAEAFCIWDGGFLPTEAEWNYAAAGGSDQLSYPWGSADITSNIFASYNGNPLLVAGNAAMGQGKYGQRDLAGNVAEWVEDAYVSPYTVTCDNCLVTSGDTSPRVLRGGSHLDSAANVTSAIRASATSTSEAGPNGARCARSAK